LHLVGCLYYLYEWCMVKQISDNEIYLLIKYIKSVLWRVLKRLSYIEDTRCLKVNFPRHWASLLKQYCFWCVFNSSWGWNRGWRRCRWQWGGDRDENDIVYGGEQGDHKSLVDFWGQRWRDSAAIINRERGVKSRWWCDTGEKEGIEREVNFVEDVNF